MCTRTWKIEKIKRKRYNTVVAEALGDGFKVVEPRSSTWMNINGDVARVYMEYPTSKHYTIEYTEYKDLEYYDCNEQADGAPCYLLSMYDIRTLMDCSFGIDPNNMKRMVPEQYRRVDWTLLDLFSDNPPYRHQWEYVYIKHEDDDIKDINIERISWELADWEVRGNNSTPIYKSRT